MIRPDTTRCYVCGGEFAGELTIIDNRAMHPRCSAEIDRLTSERDQHAEELEHNQAAVIQLKAEIERLRANQERMWCKACGTVTRDRQCDCTKSPDQDTQSLVNYADAMQAAAHEEAQENELLRAALVQIRHVCIDNAPRSCDKEMALNFIRSVVEDTLRDGPPVECAAEQKALP